MSLPSIQQWRNWIPRLPRPVERLGNVTSSASLAFSQGPGSPQMRVFGEWALVYMVDGKGFYRDHKVEKMVYPGDWILVFPEIAHAYGPVAGAHWHEVYVTFQGPVFDLWRKLGYLHPSRPTGSWLPPEQGVNRLRKFFRQVGADGATAFGAVCLLQELLGEILDEKTVLEGPEWVPSALKLLEDLPANQSVKAVADACGLGYESFRKKFATFVGTPPARYAMQRRIDRARQLMSMRRLTNKEIGELLGFYDEFHFSKVFLQMTGQSPRQFRREKSGDGQAEG